MPSSPSPRMTWDIVLPDENATGRLAADIALALLPGDLVTLSGDLGAGKTTLARGIIRMLAGNETLEVPSPTFTLLQLYELPRFPVVHADLYRVTTLAELSELGWEEAAEGAAVMVEWPERASAFIQADRLDISLSLAMDIGPAARAVRLTGFGSWAERLKRFRALRELLDSAGFGAAERIPIQGDASTRRYERLFLHPGSAILMDAPARPDGPPIRNGKSYSTIAHLAENVRPFVALARGLRERGFSAPEIYAADMENGLLLLEDLGTDGLVTHADPPQAIEHLYASAIDVLVALHTNELPDTLPVSPRIEHKIPSYDLDAFLIELELMLEWYLPHRGKTVTPAMRDYFASLWRAGLGGIIAGPKTWVLRDYHSPNLLWLPARDAVAQVGLLDFQDAVMGPAAYDVAALLMDARVDVPPAMEITLLSRYAVGRGNADPNFDPDEFARHYVTLGAQRATKILGIFARLAKRDGKPRYLAHLPRVWKYLTRALAHPSLSQLNAWYQSNVPPPEGVGSPAEQPASVP